MTFYEELVQRDLSCIWHPFTQAKTASIPIPIVKGKGSYLYAADGSAYLDAISSWWVNLHGHAHPYIANQLSQQAHQLEHVIFADFTHAPAIELAERLLRLLPDYLAKVFFADNGSTAVETALKMVFQYWHNQDFLTSKTQMICFKDGYHGDTFGAMAVGEKSLFNQPFWPFLFKVMTIDPPYKGQEDRSIYQLQTLIKQGNVAGFIFEPLIQGVGGMVTHSLEGLDELIRICNEHGILTIADEVMTGFGRTGPLFVSQILRNKIDIVCLAKGLTGGFLPLSAVACTQQIFAQFVSEERKKAFLHGHSYCANPLACRAALANLDLLEAETCQQQRQTIEQEHQKFCECYRNHPRLKRCEVVGTILAIEYRTDCESSYFNPLKDHLQQFFLAKRILLRPFGNTLHVMPPYCMTVEELKSVYEAIELTLEK